MIVGNGGRMHYGAQTMRGTSTLGEPIDPTTGQMVNASSWTDATTGQQVNFTPVDTSWSISDFVSSTPTDAASLAPATGSGFDLNSLANVVKTIASTVVAFKQATSGAQTAVNQPTRMSDGSIVTRRADGSIITQRADGTTAITYPNGQTVVQTASGQALRTTIPGLSGISTTTLLLGAGLLIAAILLFTRRKR